IWMRNWSAVMMRASLVLTHGLALRMPLRRQLQSSTATILGPMSRGKPLLRDSRSRARLAGPPQRFFKRLFLSRLEFLASGGYIEDVDCFVGLRVDEDDFDVAAVGGERRGKVVEQAGPVFRHDFHERRGTACAAVERHTGGDACTAARQCGF